MSLSEIAIILDRSGSMQEARTDHEGGLNSFIEDQKQLEGEVNFTLIQFDSNNPCEVIYDGVPLDKVNGQIQLIPRGGTPLFDAIGLGVAHLTDRINARKSKPDQVVVMVITDGENNSSKEFTKNRIKDLTQEKENKDGWKFLFLGANIDAFAEGASLGVMGAACANYANRGPQVKGMYAAVSANTRNAREMLYAGMPPEECTSALNFTDTQLQAMSDDPKSISKSQSSTVKGN